MPAAVAAWMPRSVSSKTRQRAGADTEAVGGQEEGFGVGLAVFVVFGADQSVEAVEYFERVERCGDGFAGATGNYGEWDFAMPGVDVFEDFGDGFQLWKEVRSTALLCGCRRLRRACSGRAVC
jgi:hypothetical protein